MVQNVNVKRGSDFACNIGFGLDFSIIFVLTLIGCFNGFGTDSALLDWKYSTICS